VTRSAASTAREARRARSGRSLRGVPDTEACTTGHPALFALSPALELGHMPEGGGYPVGFVEAAARLMGCADVGAVLHLCSGSLSAPLTLDARESVRPRIVADVRWLPLRPGSVRWIMADPPYGPRLRRGVVGPRPPLPETPSVLLRECAQVLAPGGVVALLHQWVPRLPPLLERIGTYGVSTGPGYRLRALTIARKRDGTLFDEAPA